MISVTRPRTDRSVHVAAVHDPRRASRDPVYRLSNTPWQLPAVPRPRRVGLTSGCGAPAPEAYLVINAAITLHGDDATPLPEDIATRIAPHLSRRPDLSIAWYVPPRGLREGSLPRIQQSAATGLGVGASPKLVVDFDTPSVGPPTWSVWRCRTPTWGLAADRLDRNRPAHGRATKTRASFRSL